jgi:hypothetical protein
MGDGSFIDAGFGYIFIDCLQACLAMEGFSGRAWKRLNDRNVRHRGTYESLPSLWAPLSQIGRLLDPCRVGEDGLAFCGLVGSPGRRP